MPSIDISQETRDKLIQAIIELNTEQDKEPMSYDDIINYLVTGVLKRLDQQQRLDQLRQFAIVHEFEAVNLELGA